MKPLIQIACLIVALVAPARSVPQIVPYSGCTIDWELMRLPDCAVSKKLGRTYVHKGFVDDVFSGRVFGVAARRVQVGKYHLAWANIPGAGWGYFDRTGLVVVQNVATMDNGADEFHHGLVRVTKENKWGLANAQGKLVVPMRYDGLLDYEPGLGWLGCSGCQVRRDPDGEHWWFTGGRWVRLGKRGEVLGPASEPR